MWKKISKFHNGLSEAERISATNFAYEIGERLRRTTELRTLGNSSWTGFCVEKLINFIAFLVSHHSSFPFGCCGGFFRIKVCMLRAHLHACKIHWNSVSHWLRWVCKNIHVLGSGNFCLKRLITFLLKCYEEEAKLNSFNDTCLRLQNLTQHKVSFHVL